MSRQAQLVLAGVALVAAAIGGACYQDDLSAPDACCGAPAVTKVLVTDAPFPFDTVQSVDVYVVSVAVSTEPDTGSNPDLLQWVTVTEPRRRINLLTLQQGTTALLGEGELPAEQYRAVRVIIDTDQSGIRFKDGSDAVVNWGGPAQQAIHAFVEAAMAVPQQGADIVIDFDVGRSFDYNESNHSFNFLPWIRAVNRAATGSIAGVVSRDTSGGGTAGPIANATVSAYGNSAGNWQIRSTGVTDATGHYRLAYLLPGPYIVGVEPPSARGLDNSLDSNVVVTQGSETQHSVTLSQFHGAVHILGASSMLVGRTNELRAIVINAQREQDPNAPIAWENLDTAVLGLAMVVDSVHLARVTAKQVGSGRIVATSGALADTLRIVVAADSSQAP